MCKGETEESSNAIIINIFTLQDRAKQQVQKITPRNKRLQSPSCEVIGEMLPVAAVALERDVNRLVVRDVNID